jgi:hypothetical protein
VPSAEATGACGQQLRSRDKLGRAAAQETEPQGDAMKRILSRWGHRQLTDDEHVELARETLFAFRRYGYLRAVRCVAAIIALGCLLILAIWSFHLLLGNQAVGGLGIGAAIGMAWGLAFVWSGYELVRTIENIKGDRKLELLVKYHDALLELARSGAERPATSETGQGSRAATDACG